MAAMPGSGRRSPCATLVPPPSCLFCEAVPFSCRSLRLSPRALQTVLRWRGAAGQGCSGAVPRGAAGAGRQLEAAAWDRGWVAVSGDVPAPLTAEPAGFKTIFFLPPPHRCLKMG